MNKFGQVSSDHHQMPLAGVLKSDVQGASYHVTYPMIHLMLPILPPVNRQMPVKTLSFSQLRLRAVINSTNVTLTIWIIEVAENVDENRTAAMETKNVLNPDLSEANKCKQCTL